MHRPEELLDAGFRSPRQTFHTFQAALDYDLPELEYRCLSADFCRRNGISSLTYREAREQLFDEHPLLRLAARLEVVSEGDQGSRRHWIEARYAGRTVRMQFVREDFYEFWGGDRRAVDGFRKPQSPVQVKELGEDELEVTTRVVLDAEKAAEVDWSKVTEARIGQDWKIDGIEEIEDPPQGPTP